MKKTCVTLVVGLGWFATACGSDGADAPDGGTARDAGDGAVEARDGGEAPPAPFLLGLALGDAVDDRAPRGWPLVLMGVAAIAEDVPEGVVLEAASLELRIEDAAGAPETWPLEALTSIPTNVVLDGDVEQVEIMWALRAEQTQALSLGPRTARLAWGGASSAPITIDVVDLEPSTDPAILATRTRRRASLEARAALLANDPGAATQAADRGLAELPDDVALLVWRAKAEAALDRVEDALLTFDTAAAIVGADVGEEPAVTVFENRRPVLDRYLGGAR